MDIFSAVELFDGFMGDLIHVLVSVAILALRAALTFLLHWEIKNEEAEAEANLNKEFREKKTQHLSGQKEEGNP